MNYTDKYIKYKTKYLELQNMTGGKNKYKGKISKNNKVMSEKKYVENVSEPWFSLILLGLKTVEGRKNKGRFKEMQVGDIIEWTNNDFAPRSVLTKIIRKKSYDTFEEYLKFEGLDKCLPGISNMKDGLSVYFKYFTKNDEIEFGVIAIELELIDKK